MPKFQLQLLSFRVEATTVEVLLDIVAKFPSKCLAEENGVLNFVTRDLQGALALVLCKLISLAIMSCTFQDKWKFGDLSPKKENYRPIFIPNNFAKAFVWASYDAYVVPQKLVDYGLVDDIFTDFSQSFDTVGYNLLLHKLDTIDCSLGQRMLLKSYLANRSNFVFYNDFAPSQYPLSH